MTLKLLRVTEKHEGKNNKLMPTVSETMGRRSKAALACLHNLSKAPLRSYKATVEDAPDSDADDANYISSMHDDTAADSDFDMDNTCSGANKKLDIIRGRFLVL
jgi:hypothetical protein